MLLPRQEMEFEIAGPRVESLPDQTTLGLFFYDVITGTDEAGNPAQKSSFEWFYVLEKPLVTEREQIVTEETQMGPVDAAKCGTVESAPVSVATQWAAEQAGFLAGPTKKADGYLFSFEDPAATTVHLAGEFNGWSTEANPMTDPDDDGIWTATIKLDPGRYQYRFVIDGGASWVEDIGNPEFAEDGYGGRNSVLVVQ